MIRSLSPDDLDARARDLGYEVVDSEVIGHPFNMGGTPNLRILRDGEPVFKFSWSAGEVDQWLRFRELEQRDAA